MSNRVHMQDNSPKLRFLQMTELRILKKFIECCEKEHLRYYLTYGTLLGAKRHGGFIPWDDDVDVAMPRKDYDIFCSKCSGYFKNQYHLRHFRLDDSYNSYVPRIEDRTVAVIDSFGNESKAWIDIFPIDGLPPKNSKRNYFHKKKLMIIRNCINMSRMATGVEFMHGNRTLKERIMLATLEILNPGRLMDSKKLYELLDKQLKKYDSNETGNCVDFMGEKFKDECDPSLYGKGEYLLFEDMEMVVPEKTDELLSLIYGDYMKLPPEHERNVHNFFDVRIVK